MSPAFPLFSPLSDHTTGDSDYFSISSGEYFEMMERLNSVQNISTAAESTLRQIANLASCTKTQQWKVNQILHLAIDHVGLVKFARLMLEDAYNNFDSKHSHKHDFDLDELLGDLTGDEQLEKQNLPNANNKEEN